MDATGSPVCDLAACETAFTLHEVGGRFGGAPTLGPVSWLGERNSEREKLGERRGGGRGQGRDVCEGWVLVSGMASLVSGVPRLSRASFEGGGGWGCDRHDSRRLEG